MTDEHSDERPDDEVFAGAYFDLAIQEAPSRIELHVIGEVDLAGRDALTAAARHIDERVQSRGGCAVIVDASRLSFCDASMVAFLVRVDGMARAAGHRCSVRHPPPVLRRLLEVLELRGLLVGGVEY